MGKPPMVKSLQLQNLLSFGPDTPAIELGPLNVLIGPNGSGKSNLIEAIGLLHAAPSGYELTRAVIQGGGVGEWLWKGGPSRPPVGMVVSPPGTGRVTQRIQSRARILGRASIEALLDYPLDTQPEGRQPLRYRLAFLDVGQRFEVVDERLSDANRTPDDFAPYLYFGYEAGIPMLNVAGAPRGLIRVDDLDRSQSILSQRKGPEQYPELTYVGQLFERIRLYRDWGFGRRTPQRLPQPTDLPNQFLEEDCSNLGLVLNQLQGETATERAIAASLQTFYEGAEGIHVNIEGGSVQVSLREFGYKIPAPRLSDGTLRWLCLLAILLHPDPPPLVCLEEPELGLHPDMMPTLADLLLEASERMQLIVTTHSDILVDSLNETPEAIVVCEKVEGATSLRRLSREEMAPWLEKYRLGHLWRSGEIGGNRW
jgi:predicted ATPase